MAKKYKNSNEIRNIAGTGIAHSISGSASIEPVAAPSNWLVIVIGVLFLFLLTLAGSMDNIVEKGVGLISSVIILIMVFTARKRPSQNVYSSPLFIAVTSYVIWGGVSTLYAASGKFAIYEFSKLLFALCAYLAIVLFAGPGEVIFKKISYLLASIGAFYGIVSIDAASAGIVSSLFRGLFGLFTDVYAGRGAFEAGIRITGIFGNPNIYAGFMALAVLLSLYLVITASDRRNARFAIALLSVNSLSYLLAFSLGSLFMFLISCAIMIGVSEKGSRINLFILMLETAVLAFVFAFVCMIGLGRSGVLSYMPLIAAILYIFVLYGIDIKLRVSLRNVLNENRTLSIRIIVLIIFIIAAFTAAAFSISNDLSLDSNESVMRAIYVKGGEYTLTSESEGVFNTIIESQSEEDLIRHTSVVLYSGDNKQSIAFTVPNDSKIVMIRFIAENSKATLHSVNYSGADQGSVHLNYPLLPNIIANRLQNLFANENMVQRGIFFEDGMKLFAKSPIIGRGLGGYENGIYGVQDFYYETKYAHNHYIQSLSDEGVVGLTLYLSILVFSSVMIIRSKKQARPLFAVPVLAASIFQMFGQALTDATWSSGVFLGFAFPLLALITLNCSGSIKQAEPIKGRFITTFSKSVLTVFAAIFILLLSGNLYAQSHAKSGVESFKEIERLILLDRFEYNDYKVSYIVNAPKAGDAEVLAKADQYAVELAKVESNSITPYVMAYNFSTNKDFDAFAAAKTGIQYAKSSPTMWWRIFDVCENYIDPVGPYSDSAIDRLRSANYYIDSVLELYDTLLERNSDALDDIILSPYNNTFVGKILEIKATQSYDAASAMTVLMAHAFDSDYAVDVNQDGIPDSITVLAGSISRNEKGTLTVSGNTQLEVNLYQKLRGMYTFGVRTETPQGIGISIDGAELQTIYEASKAYATVDLADNAEMKLVKFTVTIPNDSIIDYIDFKTNLD